MCIGHQFMQSSLKIRSTDPVTNEEEIIKLRVRLDSHIDDFRAHMLEEERRYHQDMQKQEAIANNLDNLIRSLELQVKATEGLVQAWNAASFLQRFIKWCSGFAAIGMFLAWYNDIFTR